MSKKLYLLDAYALIYRSYYAFIKNPRFTSKGLNTSAIYGFTNTLIDLIAKENPTHIAVVFDPPYPTFRHEMYKEYKANREATPEDIKKSIPIIKEIIEGFKIPVIQVDRYEADDVIGTLAKQAEKEGFTTYMMTPDKDYGQLVSDHILMLKPGRGGNEMELVDKQKICEKYSIKDPVQVIDILGLMGDSSDNIPGAPGIGEKTAMKLIKDFESIENIYKRIDEIPGKQKEKLVENKELVFLSKELATIKLDVPITIDPEQLILENPDEEKLTRLFNELEFRTVLQRVFRKELPSKPSSNPVQGSLFGENEVEKVPSTLKNISNTDHDYILVDTTEDRKNLISLLSQQKEICFDTETTGLDPYSSEIVGLSFSFEIHKAYYIPFPDDREITKSMLNEFKDIFENQAIRKIGQNIKFDILILQQYQIRVKGELFDTMIAHYLLQPDLRHNLNYLSEHYLSYKPVEIEELIGKKGPRQGSMRNVPVEQIKEYAAEDADIALQLKSVFEKDLKNTGLSDLSENLEMPLIPVLANMESTGIKIDIQALIEYSKLLNNELIESEKKIFTHAGMEFNISSPKQLGEILFTRLKLDSNAKKTKTQQYSTSEETLAILFDKHPIINDVLEYRSLKKLLSTYVEALPKLINPLTGKIHTSYNQAIASTGRLSSNNPNLQNIPIREERGREIRKAFIPSDDNHVLLAADYSQIELRIMAHLSQDTNMIAAFKNNEDIHTATAAKIFHVETTNVSKDQRRKAKTANFGIIYGISAFGLSQRLKVPRSEAKQLIDEYFIGFPRVKEYMDKSIAKAREKGYVETMMGRKSILNDINSRNSIVRGNAERYAINAPIQGSAADIIKLAMIDIFNELNKKNYKSKMILQVHDELIFDVYKPEVDEIKALVKNRMENAIKLSIPLTVDIGIGENWLEAH
ncbi:MAG: DNA polymerase I [Bacteroidetes bacterium GWC2_33_15]|nr:MAG: DNA polymerase I [Bacteroidetes bacterium GWA2_33_15]OFX50831.1 MAG: DNA polymerase I [Bacteroidetes bacterium GWC2_33_15]OFX62886.1 MAG: DNA polymerase I [Bacteroidetes bacterium GWB2_32_14]OFX69956.1 MAG: DNA polymerase I [Bacteroidetes bacterium GWD2_33_33]HAN18951.1 DNA polymerase I [Bacteroidales bacterium]